MSQQERQAPAAGAIIETLDSAALSAFIGAVRPTLDAASAAASGIHQWSADDQGRAGAQFGSTFYRLGGAADAAALEAVIAATLEPGAGSSALEVEVHPVEQAGPETVDATFDAWVRSGPDEERAIAQLARTIAAAAGDHRDLRVFDASAGAATHRNSGVAVVDADAKEAVWIFGRAVRMTVDRR